MTNDLPPLDPRDIATAGEYVLGTLPLAEREAFQRRLLAEPALMVEVARWQAHFDPIADEVRPVSPPPKIWHHVETRLFPDPRQATKARTPALWQWLALGLLGMAAVLVIALWTGQPRTETDRRLWVSDMVSADSTLRLTALYDETDGEMRVSVAGQPPAQGRDFELWLVQGTGAPISLGVMPHQGQAAMLVPEGLRVLIPDATLVITDEPAGGAPGGVATGPVIAQAAMRRI